MVIEGLAWLMVGYRKDGCREVIVWLWKVLNGYWLVLEGIALELL